MKILLLLLILFCSSTADRKKDVPTFSWKGTRNGFGGAAPQLEIAFYDGGYDVISFHQTQRYEPEGHCIMTGQFLEELDVIVVLTGSCIHGPNFELTIVGSEKLEHTMFKVTDYHVEAIKSPLDRSFGFLPNNRYKAKRKAKRDLKHYPPSGLQLNIGLHFDQEFSRRFKKDTKTVMYNIVGHAQAWFLIPSFPVKLYLDTWIGKHYDGKVSTRYDGQLKTLANLPKTNNKTHVEIYVGMYNWDEDAYGKAYIGTICTNRRFSVGFVLHWISEAGTGQTLAAYLASLLGIREDYYWPWTFRYDNQGNLCTHKGGIMDNGLIHNKWTTCSAQDFQNRYDEGELDCLLE